MPATNPTQHVREYWLEQIRIDREKADEFAAHFAHLDTPKDGRWAQDRAGLRSICYGCEKHEHYYPGCVASCPAWDKIKRGA